MEFHVHRNIFALCTSRLGRECSSFARSLQIGQMCFSGLLYSNLPFRSTAHHAREVGPTAKSQISCKMPFTVSSWACSAISNEIKFCRADIKKTTKLLEKWMILWKMDQGKKTQKLRGSCVALHLQALSPAFTEASAVCFFLQQQSYPATMRSNWLHAQPVELTVCCQASKKVCHLFKY